MGAKMSGFGRELAESGRAAFERYGQIAAMRRCYNPTDEEESEDNMEEVMSRDD
jgi:hypothetical protein